MESGDSKRLTPLIKQFRLRLAKKVNVQFTNPKTQNDAEEALSGCIQEIKEEIQTSHIESGQVTTTNLVDDYFKIVQTECKECAE